MKVSVVAHLVALSLDLFHQPGRAFGHPSGDEEGRENPVLLQEFQDSRDGNFMSVRPVGEKDGPVDVLRVSGQPEGLGVKIERKRHRRA